MSAGRLAARQLNILLITTDQHRFDALGANGNPHIRTPHLDGLCQKGMCFQNHTTSCPLCTPARASILTGRYPSSHGAWSVGVTLPKDTEGLAHWFSGMGYRTGFFGKAHFEPQMSGYTLRMDRSKPYYGFTHHAIVEDNQEGEYLEWVQKEHPELWESVRRDTHDGYPAPPDESTGQLRDCYISGVPARAHPTSWIAGRTIRFIEEAARSAKPFFAWCSFIDPHHPWNPVREYAELYDPEGLPTPDRTPGFIERGFEGATWYEQLRALPDRELRRVCAYYYAMIQHIDSAVGTILAALERLGLSDNTVVVFTADHGEHNGFHGLLRKGGYLYESILHVPLVVYVPGNPLPGRRVGGLTQHEDIAPTLLELAVARIPGTIEGISFAKALAGGESRRLRAFYEYNFNEPKDTKGIREGRLKLVWYPSREEFVLTDLAADPGEYESLASDPRYSDRLEALKGELLQRLLNAPTHRLPKTHIW